MTNEPTAALSSSTSLTVNSSEGANSPTADKTRLISLAGEMGKYANEQMSTNPTNDKTRLISLAGEMGKYANEH